MFELNNARSSPYSRRQTLHFPNVTPLLEGLSLSILFVFIMNRRGEKTQPCRSPTLTAPLVFVNKYQHTDLPFALVPHQFSKQLSMHESANEPQSCLWPLTLLCSPLLQLDEFFNQIVPWMVLNVGLLPNLRADKSLFSNDLEFPFGASEAHYLYFR